MAALLEGELEGWLGDVALIKDHVRAVQRKLLNIEEACLRMQTQLRDAASPTLLDSLSETPKE